MSNVKENIIPFTLSVLMHMGIGVLFVMSLEFAPKMARSPQQEVNVIEAVTVDESKIQHEMDKLKKSEQRKKDEEDRRQRELESDAQRVKRLREAEEQHLAELKKKKKVDTEQAAVEQERLKKLKKDSDDLALKNKQEQQQVEKLATQRKMEEEQAADRARQDVLKKQKEREQAEKDQTAKKAVGEFTSLIKAKVESVWIKPTNFAPGSACTVSVKLIPTGDVVDSKLSNCSGGDVFSRSVESAVQKASPLPVPKDPVAFDRMRNIDFLFKPQ